MVERLCIWRHLKVIWSVLNFYWSNAMCHSIQKIDGAIHQWMKLKHLDIRILLITSKVGSRNSDRMQKPAQILRTVRDQQHHLVQRAIHRYRRPRSSGEGLQFDLFKPFRNFNFQCFFLAIFKSEQLMDNKLLIDTISIERMFSLLKTKAIKLSVV